MDANWWCKECGWSPDPADYKTAKLPTEWVPHPCKKGKQTPVIRSLWTDCLYELILNVKQSGVSIEFSDVDKLVIEKSKIITEYK